ncbi:MAG: hypothetical protein WCK32_09550 [Chlorobiaceae bacterium]
MAEIEKRKAVPIPRWYFLLKQFGFWLLASISVLTGSISMAIAIYVFIDNDFIADHDYVKRLFTERPFIADIFTSIPYIWLLALVLFTLVAYCGFRHTKKGYRYSILRVVAFSMFTSLLFSVALNLVDVGGYIHRYLIGHFHVYNQLIYANEHRWTNSEKGFLGGRVIQYNTSKGQIVIRDFKKRLWLVDINNSDIRQGTHIVTGRYLKIIGVQIDNKTFKAFTIQGWEKKYRRHSQLLTPMKAPENTIEE